ncbi:hypothetical protein [Chelatococcus sp. XZ-Ab1]|uniref:hypothetical protein n=1 Tax=Chelatococcus sp. XZ-Ab1 TaxID=3034027 RepID=UPI0023E457DF|nr:hypothetical protein [Chelatococcus sp. XZ-Ab1]
MVDIEELLPEVLTRAPSAPHLEALAKIREAAKTLCRRAKLWREEDELVVVSPECEALYASQNARIHRIEWAEMLGYPLTFRDVGWLDMNDPRWRDYTADSERPRFITQLQPNVITVVPKATGALKLRTVLVPSRNALMLPDFLVEDYGEVIGTGAAGLVLSVPNPEVYNPDLAGALLTQFDAEVSRIAASAARPQMNAPRRTRARFF